MADEVKKPFLNDVSYDTIKDTITIGLPAVGVFYSTLALIWGWGYSEQVVGTIAAVVTVLGVILKINSNRYNKQPTDYAGELIVNDPDPAEQAFRFELNTAPAALADKGEITLRVVDLINSDSDTPSQ